VLNLRPRVSLVEFRDVRPGVVQECHGPIGLGGVGEHGVHLPAPQQQPAVVLVTACHPRRTQPGEVNRARRTQFQGGGPPRNVKLRAGRPQAVSKLDISVVASQQLLPFFRIAEDIRD